MFDWSEISTVLLDMDGTILDLHYDNHFWLEYLPLKYSQSQKISLSQARMLLQKKYQKVTGTLSWYCLDYWSKETQLPIKLLKREIKHLIQLRPDADDFLTALKAAGKRIVLVTNAHPDSLALKIEQTQLDKYFDRLYSTHEFGATKESQQLWQGLQAKEKFTCANTLFVDDSLTILRSAKQFGIKHLLAISNPDSQHPEKLITEFPAINNYHNLLAGLKM